MTPVPGTSFSWSNSNGLLYVYGYGDCATVNAPSYSWNGDDYDDVLCTVTLNGYDSYFGKSVRLK